MLHYGMSDFVEIVRKVIAQAKAEGITVTVNTAYRSFAYQKSLYDCWFNPECRKRRGIVAKPSVPGRSYHNWGRAIDFSASNPKRVGEIAEAHGLRYGAAFKDPVHIDDGKRFTIERARAAFRPEALVAI